MIKIYNLFISHSFMHSNSQEKLVGLLKKKGICFLRYMWYPKGCIIQMLKRNYKMQYANA